MSNDLYPEISEFSRDVKTVEELNTAILEADAIVNESRRGHRYIGLKLIEQWRKTGLLDETTPSSWEETTLVCLLENQRTMKEC